MAKVTLIVEDEERDGRVGLKINIASDPPFPEKGSTHAQYVGVEAFKLAANYAKGAGDYEIDGVGIKHG